MWEISQCLSQALFSVQPPGTSASESLFWIFPHHFFLFWRRWVFGFVYSTKEPKGRNPSIEEVLRQLRSKSEVLVFPWLAQLSRDPSPTCFLLVLKKLCLLLYTWDNHRAKRFFNFEGNKDSEYSFFFAVPLFSYPLVSPPRIPKSLVSLSDQPLLSQWWIYQSLPYPSP